MHSNDRADDKSMLMKAIRMQNSLSTEYVNVCNTLENKEASSLIQSIIPQQLNAMSDLKDEADKRGYIKT